MADKATVKVKLVRPTATVPERWTAGAAGFDLVACWKRLIIPPGEHVAIPTGVALELPYGYEGQIRPRSGLAKRTLVTVLNAPGTIDSDYRGEIEVLLINHGVEPHIVRHGDRIAQLIIQRIPDVEFVQVDELSPTKRGADGFGSTGE